MAIEPEVASLFARAALPSSELTHEEVVRYGFILTTLIRRGESAYFQSAEGTLQMEAWRGIRDTLVVALDNDYGRVWFSNLSGRFTNEYAEEISKALASVT